MKLVAYVRVSTNAQAERGFGLPVQEKAIRAWCRANGHRLVAAHRDEGVSGSNGVEDREGLPLALEDVRDGRADGVVVARLDRLARSITVQEAALAMIWRLGGVMVSVADGGEVLPDDPDDPMRTAMRQMAGVFAELDRRMIVKRLRDGRRHKASLGGYAGGAPPFGSRAESGHLVPDPAEAAALARARELRASGLSLRAIGAALTAEGHRPKRGGTWQPTAVNRLLAADR